MLQMKTVSSPESLPEVKQSVRSTDHSESIVRTRWRWTRDRAEMRLHHGSLTHSGNSAKMGLVKKQGSVYPANSYPEQSLVVYSETTTLKT